MSNVFTQMLAQINPRDFGRILQEVAKTNPTLTNPKQQILSPNVEADRVRRQQQDMDQRRETLQGVDPGMREFAPVAGLLKGLAANMQRGQDNEDLDALYAQLTQSQQAEQAQKAQEKEAERKREADAAEAVYLRNKADSDATYTRNRRDKLADTSRDNAHSITLEEAKQRAIASNRAPAKLSQQEIIQGILSQNLPASQEREALITAGGGALVKDRDAQRAGEASAADGRSRAQAGIDVIDGLLNGKAEAGPMDFFPPVAIYNAMTGGHKTPLEQASGIESALPTFPGSPASNAEASLEQLRGMTFLEVISEMKGSGTITEVEGTKGENAMAKIQLGQSDESIKQGLSELREVLSAGVGSAQAGAPTPQEGMLIRSEDPAKPDLQLRNGQWVPVQ